VNVLLPENAYSVILAGGGGTRFWPQSRSQRPKQFLPFFGARTLLQHSFDLVAPLTPPDRILVVTNSAQARLVREQLPDIPEANVLSEPCARGTAAAVARASEAIAGRNGHGTMTVLGADHWVRNPEALHAAVVRGYEVAARGHALVMYGLTPGGPNPHYGYIVGASEPGESELAPAVRVLRFHEKPPAETASRYLSQKHCYWNSGMFSCSVETVRAEMDLYAPNVLRAVRAAVSLLPDQDAFRKAYCGIPANSIDRAVLEHSANCYVVSTAIERVELRTWASLFSLLPRDAGGNISIGDVKMLDCANTVQFGSGKLVAAIGMENCAIVANADAVLVCALDRADDIGSLIDLAVERGHEELR